MYQLNSILYDVLENGKRKIDRTGVGTISRFGNLSRFPLFNNLFPLPTERKVAVQKPAEELKWFLSGSTHVGELIALDNHIWDSWMGQDGTIGPMYGEQWRNWTQGLTSLNQTDREELLKSLRERSYGINPETGHVLSPDIAMAVFDDFLAKKNKPFAQGGRGGIDQIANLVNELKTNPTSRRLVVSTWNTPLIPNPKISPDANVDIGQMALAPCHTLWQVYAAPLSDYDILQSIILESDEVRKILDDGCGSWDSQRHALSYARNRVNLSMCDFYQLGLEPVISKQGQDIVKRWKDEGKPSHELSLMLYARSQDVPLGTVFNIATYAMLTKILAKVTNMLPKEYIHVAGDYHIYTNQVPFVEEQLSRKSMKPARAWLPDDLKTIDDFDPKKVVYDYVSHPPIKYPRAAV